jgi:hypothetical protein
MFGGRLGRMSGINFLVFFIAYIIYSHQRQVGVSADSLLALDDGDRRRRTNLLRLVGAVAVGFSEARSAFAPQPEDLQQQLQQLKHEYDDTTRDLEQPSAVLEPRRGGDPAEKQTAP